MNNIQATLPRLAIFGAGGLGIEMLALLDSRPAANLVAVLDKSAYIYDPAGLKPLSLFNSLRAGMSISELPQATSCSQAIAEFTAAHGHTVDAIFFALPNLPNEFIPGLSSQLAAAGNFRGVIVDALKRSSAVQSLVALDGELSRAGILHVTGCGATPGLLTAAAAIACQSFVEVLDVHITFGVGISNWQAYRATIREDIAHLPGFDLQSAQSLTDEQIESILEERNGLLELVNMEHADDIMLQLAGVCPVERVRVGGLVDTRNPRKPVSTNVKITGLTYQGKKSQHTFTLGDETTMAANVNGYVLGCLNSAVVERYNNDRCGVITAAQLMPKFSPSLISVRSPSMV